VLLGGGRALLMQLAMPGVAAGVDEHSDFRRRPLRRLWRTLSLTYRLSFGTPGERGRAAAAINRAHASVRGKGYSAQDPRLLLWVYATLVDSALVTYETFVQPLDAAEREDYYAGSKWVAPLLGLPASYLPLGWDDFTAYVDRALAQECSIDARARALAQRVLKPIPWLPPWLFAPMNDVTAGLLPASLRAAYDLGEPGPWFRGAEHLLPLLRRRAPRLLWEVPGARRVS
jgi:uncharacterized protein (DUF2236 family)